MLYISDDYMVMQQYYCYDISHFRDDDLVDTVVIDKINIFRADRVFKVFCFVSCLSNF